MTDCEKKFPFKTELERVCEGLVFISETDEPVEPLFGDKVRDASLPGYLSALGREPGGKIEQADFDGLFDRLTVKRDWHGKTDTERRRKFLELRRILETHLSELKVIRIGRTTIEIFVVGTDRQQRLCGVRTRAVET